MCTLRNCILVGAAGMALLATSAKCQTVDPDLVETLRDAKVRSAPSDEAATVFSAPAGSDLVWIGKSEHDGFDRVIRRSTGPQGWIAAADVRVAHRAEHHQENVCSASLDECPKRGCAQPDTAEARDNAIKRTRPAAGTPVTLSFDDLMELQQQADQHVGQGPDDLSKPQREALGGLKVSAGTVAEGDLVRVLGYIAKGDRGLHVNDAGESVNCMLQAPQDNDIHIPLVAKPDDSEFRGVVVEMIPQDRPAAWNVDALKDIQTRGQQVWVEGGLSYDKVHFVNDDSARPIKDEPKRLALWEVHPIIRFFVCRKDHCDAQNESDWSALDTK